MSDFGQGGGGGFGQPPGGQPPGGQPPGGGGFGQPPMGQPPGGGGFGQPPGGVQQPAPGFGGPGMGGGMQPPSEYKTAGIMMLISGIMNILASLSWILALIWICIGVFWVVTLAGAVFELIVAISVLGGKPNSNAKTASIIGIVTGFLCANVIGMVLEIVAVVMLSKPEVENFVRSA